MAKKVLTKAEFIDQLDFLKGEHKRIKSLFKEIRKIAKPLSKKAYKLYCKGDDMYMENDNASPYAKHTQNMGYLDALANIALEIDIACDAINFNS